MSKSQKYKESQQALIQSKNKTIVILQTTKNVKISFYKKLIQNMINV